MLHRLCARVYIAIYAYMQGIYAYIEPGKYIYRSYIYVFYVYLFIFMHFMYWVLHMCKWVQIGANACFVANFQKDFFLRASLFFYQGNMLFRDCQ